MVRAFAFASCRLVKGFCIWGPSNMPPVAYHWTNHWPMKTFKVWRNFYLKDRLKEHRNGSLGNHSQKSVDWSWLFTSLAESYNYSTNMTSTTPQISVAKVFITPTKWTTCIPLHTKTNVFIDLTELCYQGLVPFFSHWQTCAKSSLCSICWFIPLVSLGFYLHHDWKCLRVATVLMCAF